MSTTLRVNLIMVLCAMIGGFLGYQYGQNEQLKFYKLLNLFGLIYDFVAVLLLSYVVLIKDKIQYAVAHYMSLLFIWFSVLFPASFHVSYTLTSISSELDWHMYIFIYISIIPMLYVYSSPVLEPKSNKTYEPSRRVKILGTILLLVGFLFQITAAIVDIRS
ncbi:hypothetical protein [Vibrio cholerae]|uniref:hypothetical protein n=1 Tax=Vibrio cholerae TaxID=666 RepID=UPI001560BA25|nr:hypothetical protein [Vibrio cholerae]NOF46594.1 hypothetical protein [Vibrio cholerae]NOF57720.1 hypothetical protein [Vibrio cholerae]